ncbi:hypothetical protein WJX84_002972 [Apatococcus fuscideae]|uniref:Radial spoke protein 3 n=1 Tax=Apatococcus fuscideae TaxID=2026836 RepID=A0AAW1RQI8_9CHLO
MPGLKPQPPLTGKLSSPKSKTSQKLEPDQEEIPYPANIMFDRRVVRGNTWGARPPPPDPGLIKAARPSPSKKRARNPALVPPRTPPPVLGRRHIELQTESYLEELTDVIEEGDLFDFDREVEPILEVLVGKVLEQSLTEVAEEEELSSLRAHQQHFHQVRAAELAAVQRLEAAERRKKEERERRIKQALQQAAEEEALRKKVATQAYARDFLQGLMVSVFEDLRTAGHFYDPVEREVKDDFLPWLTAQVAEVSDRWAAARSAVQALTREAVARAIGQRSAAALERLEEVQAASRASDMAEQDQMAAHAAELVEFRARASPLLAAVQPDAVAPELVDKVRKEMEDVARAALPPPLPPVPAALLEEAGEDGDAAAAEAPPEAPEPPKIEISDADLLQELLENDDIPRAALQGALKTLLAAEAAAAAAAVTETEADTS